MATSSLAKWVEYSPMVWETGVASQVESYQRLKKWYLIRPCLILSNIRYVSRVKWSNPGKGVVPSPTPWGSSYWKGSLRVALDSSRQLYFFTYLDTNLSLFLCFVCYRFTMVFHRNLCDSKSQQVSRTLLSILADLNNAVVSMVLISI